MRLFYVWPDGTIQDTDECGTEPYSWMSDDFAQVQAESEEEALVSALGPN